MSSQSLYSASAQPQELIKQGLAAIQKRDFHLADACFQEAAEKSGPDVYHSIGTAEAAIPGRELRAICWLAAYLAANPQASNATETKAAIEALDVKRREKTLQLIQRYADAQAEENRKDAAQTSSSAGPPRLWTNGPTRGEEARDHALQELAYQWERILDFVSARRVIGMILWDGTKTDAITTLVGAESNEVSNRFEAGDLAGAATLLADAQKDAANSPRVDYDATYRIAMTKLQIARDLIAAGNLPDARGYIASLSNEKNPEVIGSIATTEIVMARAQLKSGNAAAARATLAEAAKIIVTVNHPRSPLKYELLRDLADAQYQAGDLAGTRLSLVTAAPLTAIYNDADQIRLKMIETQLKIGDMDGALKTAALIKDSVMNAKALLEIAAPPKPDVSPTYSPPFPSQYLAIPPGSPARPVVTAAQWINLLELNLDAPCFTAFPDDSDCTAIGAEIQKEPIRLARHAGPLAPMQSLALVTRRMVRAQVEVGRLLKLQFGP